MVKTNITLSKLREITEKCEVLGVDRINKDIPKQTDEWWNMVSLLFLTTFGMLKEEAWGEVYTRDIEKEVNRFGNRAVQAVNSIIADKHPRSLLGICAVDGLNESVNIKFDNGLSLSSSLDLYGVRRENGKETPVLSKFKFAPAVSKNKDIESLSQAIALVYKLYAESPYTIGSLAYEDFPEKVLVYRISLENRVAEILTYTKQELWDGQEIVKAEVKKALALVNGEKEAKHIAGEHCVKCPFLLECEMAKFTPNTVSEHFNKALFCKSEAKAHEDEVKKYAEALSDENLDMLLDGKKEVIFPIVDKNGEETFGAVNLSESMTIVKSRRKDAPTNQDILRLLLETGLVAGEDDDVTDVKVTLNPKLVELILEEMPAWKEYFKTSRRINKKLLTPKEVNKADEKLLIKKEELKKMLEKEAEKKRIEEEEKH